MGIIKRNWKKKLLSLIIAIFLWSFIIANENPTVSTRLTSIPIVFENTEELERKGLVIDKISQQVVDITVSGKRNDIVSVTPSHIRATADLINLSEGTQKVRISYSMPDGISLENSVYNIDVNIEKIISKDFEVTVRNRGNLQQNYILESTSVTPDKITIRGPRSRIDSIESVITNMDLDTLEKDTTLNREVIAINKDENQVDNITYGQQFVNINATILKQKEVELVPKYAGLVSKDYKIVSSVLNRSKVYVKGPKDIVDKLERIETQEINLLNITESQRKSVKLSLPTDVSLVNPDQDFYIDFEVEGITTKSMKISKENIQLLNYGELKTRITNDSILLSIYGFTDDLEKINEANIKLIVNLQGKTSGTHIIKPYVEINNKVVENELIENVENITIVLTN